MLKTFYMGVKGVVAVEGKVLLLKKKDQEGKDFWDIPGGRINDDETMQETLMREVNEELPSIGNFKVGELLSAYRLHTSLEGGHDLCLLFYKIETKPFRVEISDEHFDFQWFSGDELNHISNSNCHINAGNLDAAQRSLRN